MIEIAESHEKAAYVTYLCINSAQFSEILDFRIFLPYFLAFPYFLALRANTVGLISLQDGLFWKFS